MTSRLLVQVMVNFAIALAVLIVANLMRPLPVDVGGYLAVLLVVTLGGMMFLSIGQAFVGLIKSAATISATTSLVYLILMLSGILGTLGVIGASFQSFAQWAPVGAIITILGGVLHHAAWGGQMWLSLLVCFGYIAACSFIGIKWFQWEAR